MSALLELAKQHGTPLPTRGKPGEMTFVWEGEDAPRILGDFNLWGRGDQPTEMQPESPGVWTLTATIPENAYVEYIFVLPPEADGGKARYVLDPLNRRRASNGMGKYNNCFRMPKSNHTPLYVMSRRTPRGRVTRHVITDGLLPNKGHRTVWLYRPRTAEPVPLLLVCDGRDFRRYGKLTEIVDNLIAQQRIRPIALALVDNARTARAAEYIGGELALMTFTNLILPLANAHLALCDPRDAPYGVMGASLGGALALYVALRLPQVFGRVVCMSGAFQVRPAGADSLVELLLKTLPPQPIRIWQGVGTLEWLLTLNRDTLHPLLQARGYDVTYVEYGGGHNYTCWRDQTPAALEAVFGSDDA